MLNPMTAAATSAAARTRRRRVFTEVASSSELASFWSESCSSPRTGRSGPAELLLTPRPRSAKPPAAESSACRLSPACRPRRSERGIQDLWRSARQTGRPAASGSSRLHRTAFSPALRTPARRTPGSRSRPRRCRQKGSATSPSGSPSLWVCGLRRSFFSARPFRTSKRRQKNRLNRPAYHGCLGAARV
jgi:hypothetical protein